ncbi:MAG: hypothetical protein AAB320_09165 [Elusimicrobiota bacterium]
MSVVLLGTPSVRAEEKWPDLSSPAHSIGGGDHDAAVVVGADGYAFVPPVHGAAANAKAWYDYLTKTRNTPPASVKLLLGNDATREDILEAAQKAAAKASPEGTLWFVFIGHGAPSVDGKDGLLVGVDAQQKAASLQTRSLKRDELLKALGASQAGRIVVVLDACFSGRGQDGASIAPGLQPLVALAPMNAVDPRMVVLTAAKGDQFAGSLPGAPRPAFSYLVLGGLRGWAGQARVTAGDLWRYATDALNATLSGRNQTPDLIGQDGVMVGATAGEKGPDLAALAKATAGGGSAGGGFQVTNLPEVPKAQAPKALESDAAAGLDFHNLDIEALKKKDETIKLDKSDATAVRKAEAWRQLARDVPQYADKANERATQWESFATQQKTVEDAKQTRIEARDADWAKVSKLLRLDVIPETEKARWAEQFVRAYYKSPGLDYEMAWDISIHLPKGSQKKELVEYSLQAPKEYFQPILNLRKWGWKEHWDGSSQQVVGVYGRMGAGSPMVAIKTAEILLEHNWVFYNTVGERQCIVVAGVVIDIEAKDSNPFVGCGRGDEGALQAALKTRGETLHFPTESNATSAFFKRFLPR